MLAEYLGKDGANGFVYGSFHKIKFVNSGVGCQVVTNTGKVANYSNQASAEKNWRIVYKGDRHEGTEGNG